MAGFRFSSNIRLDATGNKMVKQAKLGLQDCIDDVVRTSSQNAPHDEGILEKSWTKQVKDLEGTVSYTVKKTGGSGAKHGNFNYALKMHEEHYNLGVGSERKTGGVGMSGKQYEVGTGYLGNVIKGEKEAYIKHIEEMVKNI
jgi:hypothetical protein